MSRAILLADDSVTIQKVVELTFMDEDWDVVAVSNGDEALIRLASARPDFVIVDVHMPGASGYEVCRRVKADHPEVPVLLLVGTFEPFDADEATACGADGHLKKPFDSQELLRLVGEMASVEAAAEVPTAEPDLQPEAVEAVETAPAAEAREWEAGPEAWEEAGAEPGIDGEGRAAAEEGGDPEQPIAAEGAVAGEAAWTDLESEDAEPEAATAADVEPWSEGGWGESVGAEEPVDAEPEPQPEEAPAAGPAPGRRLSDEDVDRIARRVAEMLGEKAVREVAWEVVPDLAEVVIKDRLRELESQLEQGEPTSP